MGWRDNNHAVGIIGGMGSYATLDFYKRLLDAFPSDKDWDKPRILIDNYASLPSRVRAILYHENEDVLIDKLAESYRMLLNAGATSIVSVCHTSHHFLRQIVYHGDGQVFLDLIELAKQQCENKKINKVRLMASEGTVQAGIYTKCFGEGIEVVPPDEEQLKRIRGFIECVKQNNVLDDDLTEFRHFLNEGGLPVILGCSELPVLYRKCREQGLDVGHEIIDPLQSAIDIIVSRHNES